MEITILCENASSDVGCLAEWGFSAFIRFKGTNVLFDTGYSDVYLLLSWFNPAFISWFVEMFAIIPGLYPYK